MENSINAILKVRKKHVPLWALSTALLAGNVTFADDLAAAAKASSEEVAKRVERSFEAKKHVVIGDAAYEAKDYKEAYESYVRALTLLPNSNQTAEYVSALRDRHTKAAVEYSKVLNREGKPKEAQELLTSLLEVKEYSSDPLLAKAEANAYDPIRNNPALTGEHTQNVEKVRKLLYIANGAYESGQFDKAIKSYDSVLRIDPYNTAARRGLTQTHKERTEYARTAHGETRSRLLTDVELAWEIPPSKAAPIDTIEGGGTLLGFVDDTSLYENKMNNIFISRFDVNSVSLENALDIFKQLVKENDIEPDVEKKGINLVLNLGDELNTAGSAIREKLITLNVGNMPAANLLELICNQVGAEWSASEYAVTVVPNGQSVDKLFTRRFNVPPSFMQSPLKAREGNAIAFDQLGEGNTQRVDVTPKSYLESAGVVFPEGAAATYSRTLGVLTVVNSPGNIRTVDNFIQDLKNAESVQVNVKVKVIDILETDLEELGYDWILGSNELTSSTFLGGGTPGNGTAINPTQVGISNTTVGNGGITSGLRSGAAAFPNDSINDLLLNGGGNQGIASDQRAPGILVGSVFANDTAVQGVIRGMSQKTGRSRVWQSGIVTSSGQRSRIEQVRLFTFPSEYDPPELPDNIGGAVAPAGGVTFVPITPATPSSFEQRPVGRTIDIEATISGDRKTISVNLEPTFSDFIGFVNYGSPIMALTGVNGGSLEVTENAILQPIFERISAESSVTLYDGATIAIGGLQTVEVSEVNDRVPVLSSLPFVGDFFKTNGTETVKRAVVIFVTAELIDATGKRWRDQ